MQSTTLKDLSVREYLKDFVCVKLPTKDNRDLIKFFGLKYVPQFYVLDSKGELIGEFTGFRTSDKFIAEIKEIVEK